MHLIGLVFQAVAVIAAAGFMLERVFPETQLRVLLPLRNYFAEMRGFIKSLRLLQLEGEVLKAEMDGWRKRRLQPVEDDIERVKVDIKRLKADIERSEVAERMVEDLSARQEDVRARLDEIRQDLSAFAQQTLDYGDKVAIAEKKVDKLYELLGSLSSGPRMVADRDYDHTTLDDLVQQLHKPSFILVAFLAVLLFNWVFVGSLATLTYRLVIAFGYSTLVPWYSWILLCAYLAAPACWSMLVAYEQLPRPISLMHWWTWLRWLDLSCRYWIGMIRRSTLTLISVILCIVLWLPSWALASKAPLADSKSREYYYAAYAAAMFGLGISIQIAAALMT